MKKGKLLEPKSRNDMPGKHVDSELIQKSSAVLTSIPSLQNCGLVAEARCIDERSEWRTFGDKVLLAYMNFVTSFAPDMSNHTITAPF